ncbi:MAG: hypothetical protein ACLTYN_14995 [Dysosmobacter welbionis]
MRIPASGRRCGKWSGEAPNGRGLQPKLPAEPAFEVAGGGNLGNIGQRNIESVHMTLRTEGVRLLQEDVGTVARPCF